jgi:two-component system, LytTR family, sensor kinase
MQRRRILANFGFFTLIGLLFFFYKYLDYPARGLHTPFTTPLIEELTGAWTVALVFPLLLRFIGRYPIVRAGWPAVAVRHIGAMLLFSAVHTSLMWLSRSIAFPLLGLGRYDYGIMPWRFAMEFFHDVIVYWTIIAVVLLWDHRVRASQLEARLATARLENLRLQLQPHFLFNALNTISSVMYEDPRRADAMIAQLSELLRSTLEDSDAQEVSLEHEIRTLELYLDIMRRRFEENLKVEIRVAPELRKALVPQLLLQPLVENSIRHGIDPASNAVSVTVTAEREGNDIRLQVRDSGRGMPEAPVRRGKGLSNTAERLRQLYGARHRLELRNCEGGGLLVTVAVPYHT